MIRRVNVGKPLKQRPALRLSHVHSFDPLLPFLLSYSVVMSPSP